MRYLLKALLIVDVFASARFAMAQDEGPPVPTAINLIEFELK
jgi:hypothetical protein